MMNALEDNENLVKFYTGLPDYDTLKAVLDLCCNYLPSTAEHGCRQLTNQNEFF